MKTSDFYYDLPKELIAQTPLEPRDSSRLLVLDREKQTLEHKHFYDIIDYLNEGDLLVANDSRVLPARIYGIKDETGAKVEFLLLKQVANNRWETLCKPGKKAKVGTKFSFGKHGQKEIESLFERHGLKAFITSAPIRNSLQMMNSLFSIRNNVIHEDASPSLTHQTIKAHKDNIMHFVDLLEIDITANHKAYYNN